MKKTQLVIIGALASMPLFSGCDTIGDSVDMMRDSLQKNIDPQWLGRTNYNTVVVTTVVVTNVVTVTNVVVKPSAVQSTTPH